MVNLKQLEFTAYPLESFDFLLVNYRECIKTTNAILVAYSIKYNLLLTKVLQNRLLAFVSLP